jgi:uncharacterized UBP type Zn finger protein
MSEIEEAVEKKGPQEYQKEKTCEHIEQVHDVQPGTQGCEDCLKTGDSWVHLRLCMTCGYVGCCDNSKNKHATRHFHNTGHPVIRSFQPGEDWMWCYVDKLVYWA